MAKDFRMGAETGRFKLTGQDAGMVRTTIHTAIPKNWSLVAIYLVITLAGIASSYWTGQWISVAVSLVVAVITLVIGYYMAQRIITITHDQR